MPGGVRSAVSNDRGYPIYVAGKSSGTASHSMGVTGVRHSIVAYRLPNSVRKKKSFLAKEGAPEVRIFSALELSLGIPSVPEMAERLDKRVSSVRAQKVGLSDELGRMKWRFFRPTHHNRIRLNEGRCCD